MKENKLFPLKKTIVAFAVLSGLAGAFPLVNPPALGLTAARPGA